MAQGLSEVVELVKDLEAALAIVRTNASAKLNLTLEKAEVELKMTAKVSTKAGIKFDWGVSWDTSIEKDSSDIQVVKLELSPKGSIGKMGWEETHALADAIVELAALYKDLGALTDFDVTGLKLSVAFEKSSEQKLQVIGGGGRTSKTGQRINLTFFPT
jgi:Trypsin-co-occurring domain 2